MSRVLYVLTGPTGIGKSRLAFYLAERHNGEIISADSRQIYRYMDIGTDKPGPQVREKIPHHLIDLFTPDEIISAGRYAELADKAMKEIWDRGKRAFLVGGSGLYIRAALKGIFEGPGRDESIRRGLEEEVEKSGTVFLYERLMKIDRECAIKIHPGDKRRIIRALEVYELTGRKMSEWQKDTPSCSLTAVKICLYQDMKDLYQKIEHRVDIMIERGLVDEVRKLIEEGFGESFAVKDTIGYKEILEYINGNISLRDSIMLLKRNSRRLAKGQMTWFRGEQGLGWIKIEKGQREEEILARLEEAFGLKSDNSKGGDGQLAKSVAL